MSAVQTGCPSTPLGKWDQSMSFYVCSQHGDTSPHTTTTKGGGGGGNWGFFFNGGVSVGHSLPNIY